MYYFNIVCAMNSRPFEKSIEESKQTKRKTPFEATFSEFLSSTPIVRGASTSTRRVRSIFANRLSNTSSKPNVSKPKSSRLNKIVRTATNLFAGVSSTSSVNMMNYPVEMPYMSTIHNTNDNFKNLGDFLVWYV